MKYFILGFKNWKKFKGRANRSEFWFFTLFYFIITIILTFIDVSLLGYNPYDPTSFQLLEDTFNLVALIPSLSLTVRRLHGIFVGRTRSLRRLAFEYKAGSDGDDFVFRDHSIEMDVADAPSKHLHRRQGAEGIASELAAA